jgi:hypothetical protein
MLDKLDQKISKPDPKTRVDLFTSSDPSDIDKAWKWIRDGRKWTKGNPTEVALLKHIRTLVSSQDEVYGNVSLVFRKSNGKVTGSQTYVELDALLLKGSTGKMDAISSIKTGIKANKSRDIDNLMKLNSLSNKTEDVLAAMKTYGWSAKRAVRAEIVGTNLKTGVRKEWTPDEFNRILLDRSQYEQTGKWKRYGPSDINYTKDDFETAAFETVKQYFKQ